ncbi:MAG TPA: helix-turn-helix domain-containing protein [Sphingomonas sp.]|nr:helix-turn-helix domain-containing protein [Sphingomonas sp.]
MTHSPADDGQYRARRRALAAAREVLRSHGYRSFSVERVAKAAGLSRRTLYNQFEDRTDLYRAVRLELVGEVEAALPREISRSLPLQTAIEHFVGETCRALAGDAHMQLRSAVARDGAELPWLAALYRERVTLPLEWAVERCLLQQAHGNMLLVDEPAAQAQRLVAMMMASVVEPTAFHPSELAAIFLSRLRAPIAAFAGGQQFLGHSSTRPDS